MKFGIRTPSLKRRFAARTSWKRYVRHSMGLKAPRGMGVLTNPKKALYNKVYNKTSVSVDKLFKSGKSKQTTSNVQPPKVSGSFWISLIIFILLTAIFYPLGIGFLIYKLYKRGKKKSQPVKTEIIESKAITQSSQSSNNLVNSLFIPEPTRSLLWVTDEDTSKISPVHQIRINISVDVENKKVNTETVDESYNFYSEPSLIWSRLPIQENNELETEKMYYPTYSGFSPKQRYQYLNWLKDVTQETNLSYVFLYYYGLERQLLVGNYDLAVDEILSLIKYHDKGTFKGYAVNALVLGSGYRKRPDIIKKAPFILDEPSDISLYLQWLAKDKLSAGEIMALANRVGFTNKRYIKEFPEMFKEELQRVVDTYEKKNGDLLQIIDIEKLPKDSWASMANISIPDEIRTSSFPDLLNGSNLKSTLKELLQEAHLEVKKNKKAKSDIQ